MHFIEPFYRWTEIYNAEEDQLSPFFKRTYHYNEYTNAIYGYYIHPAWDFIGSETLYIKLLFVDYKHHVAIIEMIGEWNDTLHNDIMHFKRNVIDVLIRNGVNQFILIGENILNFHGSDDCYYEEWFDYLDDGWIAALNFRDFVLTEWKKYQIDCYINFGGNLDIVNWRTVKPLVLYKQVKDEIRKRIALI